VRVERLCQEFDVEFDAWAFDLRPGIPPDGLPRDQVYRGSRYPPGYLERLREMARQSGIEMIAPPVVVNTAKAHQATEFAKDGGRLRQFHRAVFSAYWERGENIGLDDVLCRLARECGLDGDELRAALADARYAQRVQEQIAWAREVGLGGVPTCIFNDKFSLVGAQDYNVFADIARRIQRGALKPKE
jgi:predicted DsbA family dithiol-disulfide isomerase